MSVSINGNGTITGVTITTTDLADSSVTTAKIAAGAVETADIADSAVTTAKIAANAVTVAKLAREGSSGQVLTSNGAGSDPSYQTISTTPTTAQVLTATAGAAVNAVGTYVVYRDGSSWLQNTTRAGSAIGTGLSGTWRAMQNATNVVTYPCGSPNYVGVYLRIS